MARLVKGGAFVAAALINVVLFDSAAQAALSISVPTSASLGAASPGSTSLSGQLGPVTVNASNAVVFPSFTAAVSASVFLTGAGGTNEKIAKSAASYWSGPATLTAGALNAVPGQINAAAAQSLSSSQNAFGATGLALTIQVVWNPTLIITIPSNAVAGTYTGTITHSVA